MSFNFTTSVLALVSLLTMSSEGLAANVQLSGQLLEKGTRKPLADVNVFVLPAKLKAVTDQQGRFAISDVPDGEFQWVVNLSGYERLELSDVQLASESVSPRTLYLEKSSYEVYETTIYGKAQQRDDSARSLKASQAVSLPGSGNDPIRAVQNLPGVNRPAAFQSQVIIQGSAPQDTRYNIDGHEVPLIFHFGGLSSVILPESLDRVDYLSAGFDPDSGRAMGGLVGVWTRAPRKDRLHGFAFVDIFNAGASIEGPIGKDSSFLLGLRKSYIGEVLGAVLEDEEDFNLTTAPSFSDVTGVYDSKLDEKTRFRLVANGSVDTLEFILKQPVDQDPSIRGEFFTKTTFFRLIPQLTHRNNERTTTRFSLGVGRDWVKVSIGEDYFSLRSIVVTGRTEVESKITESWVSSLGMDHRLGWASVDLSLPNFYSQGGVANPISTGERRLVNARDRSHQLGFYSKNQLILSPRWSISPGVRVDHYSTTGEWLPAPRLAIRHTVDESLSVKTKGGLYYQPPREQETSSDTGNPDIRSPRAWHAAFGVNKDFRGNSSRGFSLDAGTFYRYFENLIVASSTVINNQPENFNNTGRGRAYGAETILKFDFAPWSGWVSYTLSRSTRSRPFQPEYLSQYDQTHNLNLLGSVDLPKNWKLAARIRLVSGNPTTPITGGTYDSDNDVYLPERGLYYSERLSPFYQLDVRLDKKWIYDRWILSAYLDIQNVTNHRNIESVQYAYDYESRTDIAGLPILPTIGIKGEF